MQDRIFIAATHLIKTLTDHMNDHTKYGLGQKYKKTQLTKQSLNRLHNAVPTTKNPPYSHLIIAKEWKYV